MKYSFVNPERDKTPRRLLNGIKGRQNIHEMVQVKGIYHSIVRFGNHYDKKKGTCLLCNTKVKIKLRVKDNDPYMVNIKDNKLHRVYNKHFNLTFCVMDKKQLTQKKPLTFIEKKRIAYRKKYKDHFK